MSHHPLISIIIPVYGVERYIGKCLDSVVEQSYRNLEILCIDDVSPDNSIEILETYAAKDPRIKIIRHEENKGLPGARNTGLKEAKGQYVFFLDSDDWLTRRAIEVLSEVALKDKVDIVLGGILKVDEDTGKKYQDNHARYLIKDLHNVSMYDYPYLRNAVIACNKLVRKEFIDRTGLVFHEGHRRFEDVLTLKWYMAGARLSLTTELTYLYRQRVGSAAPSIMQSSQDCLALRDRVVVMQDLAQFEVENGLYGEKGCLWRILRWIIPAAFNWYKELGKDSPEVRELLASFTDLMSLMPDLYIVNYPSQMRIVCLMVKRGSFEWAFSYIALKSSVTWWMNNINANMKLLEEM